MSKEHQFEAIRSKKDEKEEGADKKGDGAIRNKKDEKEEKGKADKEGTVKRCPHCGQKMGKVENVTDKI